LLLWDNPKLERQTRAYKTFSGVGYYVESPSWNKRLHLADAQADALLALDELVWDTRELNWLAILEVAKAQSAYVKASYPSEAIKLQRAYRDKQQMVLRHAEQMIKLGYFSPTQSAFVTHEQFSSVQFKLGALLFDPFLQKRLKLELSAEQKKDLIARGFDASAPHILSDEQRARLDELTSAKPQPTTPPDLPAPSDEQLAQISLSVTFRKLKETEQALGLSAEQLKALRELERLTRLGMFWIERREPSQSKTEARETFIAHAAQIALLGILTPAQHREFELMC
jgi:hypothetical protein